MAQRNNNNNNNFYALYIHVPFCEKKCGYCSFYSLAGHNNLIDSWLETLGREAKFYTGSKIKTIYIGGGTPSILNISQWHKLINIIRENFDINNLLEATCEANPNSLTRELINFLRENFFTRVSLGVQSLNDNELKILGRLHDSRIALNAMNLINESGLNLSCDLIFAIPGQTLRTWADSLKRVIKFASHISTYQLTLEPGTPLFSKYDNESLNYDGYKFFRYAQYYLPRKNFLQYEISNFALSGYECLHNLSYWNHDNVIALGPSAVSYLDGVRLKNPPDIHKYFKLDKNLIQREKLSERENLIELAILSLRTKYGVKRSDLLPEVEKVLMQMPRDLFIITPERISLSKRGMRVGNSIWSELIGL